MCGKPTTKVLETRHPAGDAAVRRRRCCSSCDHRFTTFERIEPAALTVIKNDGRRQQFDRRKLTHALLRASHKRDVDPRALESIVDSVVSAARDAGGEIRSADVGRLCLEGLEPIDRGAFLQFAGTLPDELAPSLGNRPNPRAGSVRDGEDSHSSETDSELGEREESI